MTDLLSHDASPLSDPSGALFPCPSTRVLAPKLLLPFYSHSCERDPNGATTLAKSDQFLLETRDGSAVPEMSKPIDASKLNS